MTWRVRPPSLKKAFRGMSSTSKPWRMIASSQLRTGSLEQPKEEEEWQPPLAEEDEMIDLDTIDDQLEEYENERQKR